MEALLVSTGVVALAEIGDKTMLLSLVLAARFRAPVPLIAGILAATLLNHGLAALLGQSVAGQLGDEILRWLLGLSFLAMAAWLLFPDSAPEEERRFRGAGPFVVALIAFFIAEMGDKTQVATIALAARYESVLLVTAGTTIGMLLVNVPAVLAGGALAGWTSGPYFRYLAAAVVAALGIATLVFG
ncbi:MAG: TMEM165/GDT1 family protein [Minwuia sp.]|uniref:TMEM165/GDT1 family protein n=1 Tax=Minwuia sp. TaxID=2493630 RepID=UPI003A8B86C4